MFRLEESTGAFLAPSPFMLMTPPARAVTAADVSDEVLGGAWVIDLRSGRRAADPSGVVGWLRPVEDGFAVLADSPDEFEESYDISA